MRTLRALGCTFSALGLLLASSCVVAHRGFHHCCDAACDGAALIWGSLLAIELLHALSHIGHCH